MAKTLPESAFYSLTQARHAAGITKIQVEQWIHRGFLVPTDTPGRGKQRRYVTKDVVFLALLAELSRTGVRLTSMPGWMHSLNVLKRSKPILAVWQGPTKGGARSSTAPPYNPENPPFSYAIVAPGDLSKFAADPAKRCIIVVNLDHLETRVRLSLAASEG